MFLFFSQYKTAKEEDLWKILTETGHEDGTLPSHLTITKIMKNWTRQTGYPVVTIGRLFNRTGIAMQVCEL